MTKLFNLHFTAKITLVIEVTSAVMMMT